MSCTINLERVQPDMAARPRGANGYLTIDLGALGRNYSRLASAVAPGRTAAVVKADAYGLGARHIAPRLYDVGCRRFFVAQFSEALFLRDILPWDALIFVLNGLQPGNEAACADRGIVPVLNCLQQFRRWDAEARSRGRRLPAVLQFDTGMSRLGFAQQERTDLRRSLGSCDVQVLFIMSHLASADDPRAAQNADQLSEVQHVASEFSEYELSLANSGGILLGPSFHGVLTRPGIALYGGSPIVGSKTPLESVVGLEVAVVQTRTVPAGTKIGYGGAHVALQEMRLATVAAGYADGLPRTLSDRGAVYVRGIRLPIVGRVSMDSMTIDVTALPGTCVSHGSFVEVLGPHQSIDDLASDAGTISYEILTNLGTRYHRQYL